MVEAEWIWCLRRSCDGNKKLINFLLKKVHTSFDFREMKNLRTPQSEFVLPRRTTIQPR